MSINRIKADFQPYDVSNPNLFINGNFDVYQRGTFVANGFGPDRWMANSASVGNLTVTRTGGWSRMAITPTPNLNSYLTVVQRLESKLWNFGVPGEDLGIPTKVTLSGWWFRAPGMEADGAHTIIHIPTSGVQDDWSAGFTNGQRIDASLVDGWNFLTFTYDVTDDMLSLGFGVALGFWNTSAGGSSGSVIGHIANMKLEWGDTATRFEADDPTVNWNKCARYYWKKSSIGLSGVSNDRLVNNITFPTAMRETPTLTVSNISNGTGVEFGQADIWGCRQTADHSASASCTLVADAEL